MTIRRTTRTRRTARRPIRFADQITLAVATTLIIILPAGPHPKTSAPGPAVPAATASTR